MHHVACKWPRWSWTERGVRSFQTTPLLLVFQSQLREKLCWKTEGEHPDSQMTSCNSSWNKHGQNIALTCHMRSEQGAGLFLSLRLGFHSEKRWLSWKDTVLLAPPSTPHIPWRDSSGADLATLASAGQHRIRSICGPHVTAWDVLTNWDGWWVIQCLLLGHQTWWFVFTRFLNWPTSLPQLNSGPAQIQPLCRHGCPSAVDYDRLIEWAWHGMP